MQTLRTTTISILALGLLAGSAVGVAAQDDGRPAAGAAPSDAGRPAAVSVDGTISVDGAACTQAADWVECSLVIGASDERLSGDGLVRSGGGGFQPSEEDPVLVIPQAVRVENADGAWTGGGVLYARPFAEAPFGTDQPTWVLAGEGAHDGLTAVLRVEFAEEGTVGGAILEGDLPAAPPLE